MAPKAKAAPKKKGTPKTATPKAKADPKAAAFDKAFVRWQKGEQICVLAAELGNMRRGALRRQLRKRAGGKDQFKVMRATGAGGIRASLGERPKSVAMDAKATLIPIGGRKGWTHRTYRTAKGVTQIHVSGKGGKEYVMATGAQKADVLCEMGNGLPPARLVAWTQPK